MDFHTDHLIQETIREEFKDSILVTIAHRLRTVMDYDRIVSAFAFSNEPGTRSREPRGRTQSSERGMLMFVPFSLFAFALAPKARPGRGPSSGIRHAGETDREGRRVP